MLDDVKWEALNTTDSRVDYRLVNYGVKLQAMPLRDGVSSRTS